jgi:putative colanic acid biosynthesis glycosyltransferase WcaI
MRVAFICPVFPPEPAPAGVMARALARRLAEDGHEVTVFTQFPNRPAGKLFPGYRRRLRLVEQIDGFRLVRCPNWLLGAKRRLLDRMLENFTFGLSSCLNLAREPRPDVVLMETWPLFAMEATLRLCALRQTPVVTYVQDCYPEALEYTGQIAIGGPLARILRQWDASIGRRSARVIAISDGMKSLLCSTRKLRPERVAAIPNWNDCAGFGVAVTNNSWRDDNGIARDAFVALFAGTLGHVSGASLLVDVARKLSCRPEVLVVCVGEGVLKQGLQERVAAAGLWNIRFLPVQPAGRVAVMHAAADVTLLTLQANYPDSSVPSKLISYLAAGRPVVCAAQSDSTVATIVRESRSGLSVAANNVEAIAAAVIDLLDHPAEAGRMGANARRCYKERFTFERAYPAFERLLREAADVRPANATCVENAPAQENGRAYTR